MKPAVLILSSCVLLSLITGIGVYFLFIRTPECNDGEEWDQDTEKCKSKCLDSEEWDSTNQLCKSKCLDSEEWDTTNEKCKRKFYKCQFIKIIKNKDLKTSLDGHLSIREFEAYDENGDNVALNKTVEASSIHSKDSPKWVVDGKSNIPFHTGNNTQPEWILIDLGSELNITKIKIWRQAHSKWGQRMNGATIQLLASDGTTVVHSVTAEMLDTTKAKPYEQEFNFDEITKESFINVYSNKNYSFL